jgi:hypothetical protein
VRWRAPPRGRQVSLPLAARAHVAEQVDLLRAAAALGERPQGATTPVAYG